MKREIQPIVEIDTEEDWCGHDCWYIDHGYDKAFGGNWGECHLFFRELVYLNKHFVRCSECIETERDTENGRNAKNN